MQREVHKPLSMRVLRSPAYCRPPARQPAPAVKADSPALLAMTDLRVVPPATIVRSASLPEADRIMRTCGVRLLVVVGAEHMIEGLITARDTQGERPVKLLLERRGRYEDLRVEDLMVPMAAIEVLDLATVQHAEVGHIVATLKDVGRQHALVVQAGAKGEEQLCGVFSATQIGRQLGMDIPIFDVAHTFAQIAAHLAR